MESSSLCLLCFDDSISSFSEPQYHYSKYKEMIFLCCKRLLSEKIKGNSFSWSYSKENSSPMCLQCFQSAEKLWEIEEKLKRVNRDLENYLANFSKEILQSRLNVVSKRANIVNNDTEAIEDPSFILGVSSEHSDLNRNSFSMSSLSLNQSDVITLEVFKEEPSFEDTLIEDNFSDSEMPSACEPQVDNNFFAYSENTKTHPKENVSSPSQRTLRVSLERLQFDENGSVILPNYTNKTFGKRKAAVTAMKALRKYKATENKTLSLKSLFRFQKNSQDDDYTMGFGEEDLKSDSEENCSEIPTKKLKLQTHKRKKQIKKKTELKDGVYTYSDFSCVVCQLKFQCSKELDAHSEKSGHVNKRTLECSVCKSMFYRSYDLKKHLLACNFKEKSCEICGAVHQSYSAHKHHMSKHNVSAERRRNHDFIKLKCSTCSKVFNFARELDAHSKETGHVNEKKHHCEKCLKTFYRVTDKRNHNRFCNFSSRSCEYCGETFTTYSKYYRHVRTHDDIKPQTPNYFRRMMKMQNSASGMYKNFKCVVCSETFKYAKFLYAHSQESGHVNNCNFQCKKCSKQFYRQCDLREHYRRTTDCSYDVPNRLPYKASSSNMLHCTICDQRFLYRDTFMAHQNSHKGETPFKCKMCKAEFISRRTLNQHRLHHSRNDKVQCQVCNKFYRNEKSLSRHMTIHTGENRVFKCDSCDLNFEMLINLIGHKITVHGMESPFKCKHCQMTFSYYKDLLHHLKAKHDETPPSKSSKQHFCEICGKKFKNARTVRMHRYTHTTIPKEFYVKQIYTGSFQCEECGKVYTLQAKLKEHMQVYHGPEEQRLNFTCHICGKRLSGKLALNTHLRIHTDETYDCEICGRGFKARRNLKFHHIRIHEQNKTPRKSYTRTPFSKPKHPTNMNV